MARWLIMVAEETWGHFSPFRLPCDEDGGHRPRGGTRTPHGPAGGDSGGSRAEHPRARCGRGAQGSAPPAQPSPALPAPRRTHLPITSQSSYTSSNSTSSSAMVRAGGLSPRGGGPGDARLPRRSAPTATTVNPGRSQRRPPARGSRGRAGTPRSCRSSSASCRGRRRSPRVSHPPRPRLPPPSRPLPPALSRGSRRAAPAQRGGAGAMEGIGAGGSAGSLPRRAGAGRAFPGGRERREGG